MIISGNCCPLHIGQNTHHRTFKLLEPRASHHRKLWLLGASSLLPRSLARWELELALMLVHTTTTGILRLHTTVYTTDFIPRWNPPWLLTKRKTARVRTHGTRMRLYQETISPARLTRLFFPPPLFALTSVCICALIRE